jgi:hypothetical protein
VPGETGGFAGASFRGIFSVLHTGNMGRKRTDLLLRTRSG